MDAGADSGVENDEDDAFATKLMSFEQGGGEYTPLVIGRSTLKKLSRTTVFIKKWPPPLRYQFFRNIISDISINDEIDIIKIIGGESEIIILIILIILMVNLNHVIF